MSKEYDYSCPVEAAIDVIGGKWKPWIIWCLRDGELRFSELQKELSGVSPKMLTKQLRDLEEDGIISRKIYPEIPPKVEYSLTSAGRTAIPLVVALSEWGSLYVNEYGLKSVAYSCPKAARAHLEKPRQLDNIQLNT